MDTDIFKSLANIITKYSIFEPDQILTPEELNSISGYLDDQTRLSLVSLLGVGVVGGLRVSLKDNVVTVTKGVGITTDGDLLCYRSNRSFDKYKLYDKSRPKYKPFLYVGDNMLTVYELVEKETTDTTAAPLGQFNTATGKNLQRDMVAMLLMESYLEDPDLCTGTGCDNLGKTCLNSPKLLLVDKASVKPPLKTVIPTPHQAYLALDEAMISRPAVTAVKTFNDLDKAYRDKCAGDSKNLLVRLQNLYPQCSAFLDDIFPADPSAAFNKLIEAPPSGIQYYYDFLKDVTETYNEFRRLLCGDHVWLCPNLDEFPKHLLLGNVAPGPDPEENRTGFYPSPLVDRKKEPLEHARFLARKLDTLIKTFEVPAGGSILITPSLSEDHPLEERAIPYYYQENPADTFPVHTVWNYRMRGGEESGIYSYNASKYKMGKGFVLDPFGSQISRFSFFRIEGHLGMAVNDAHSAIENLIGTKNLPFAVRSVMLAPSGTKPIRPLPPAYTDLHSFHFLLRQEITQQLQDVKDFGDKFQGQVEANSFIQVEPRQEDYKKSARTANLDIHANAQKVAEKLALNYQDFSKAGTDWKVNLGATMKAAGDFKLSLGEVIRTDFTTPLDSVISSPHAQWLDWLDEIIRRKDDNKDDKVLFANFSAQHPGLEHLAGVRPGGTFVLVYGADGKVVADFALPYFVPEPVPEVINEKGLGQPDWKPAGILKNAINIQPSREQFMGGKITAAVDAVHKGYADVFKESFTTMSGAMANVIKVPVVSPVEPVDPKLKAGLDAVTKLQNALEFARSKLATPTLTAEEKKVYTSMESETENSLASAVTATTNAAATVDVSEGTPNREVLNKLANSAQIIKDTTVKTTLTNNIGKLTGRIIR